MTDTDLQTYKDALRRLRRPAFRRNAAFTIIALVDDMAGATAVRSALRDLARRHPARALVVIRLPDEAPGIDTTVSLVARESRGISAVCFEDVLLRVRGDAVRGLPAVVEASVLPGLPVVFWPYERVPTLEEPMLALANRVLVDSGPTGTIVELPNLLALGQRMPITDLAWVALEPWRDAADAVLANRMHTPSRSTIRGIEISGERGPRVLLAAWLMSRFALERHVVRLFEADRIAMHIRAREDDQETVTVITEFAIERKAAQHRANVAVTPRSPLEVLDRALGRSGGDAVWERAVGRALEMGSAGLG